MQIATEHDNILFYGVLSVFFWLTAIQQLISFPHLQQQMPLMRVAHSRWKRLHFICGGLKKENLGTKSRKLIKVFLPEKHSISLTQPHM